jgi:catechol 2,3-dioxygenase-like lactoylglutathione lyase family enzyme
MLAYVTLGTNDLARAHEFYDALLGQLGAKRLMELPEHAGFTMYGTEMGRPSIVITNPIDGGSASVGNGTMVALPMRSRAAVDEFHAKAISLGASDEGAPGLRSPEGPNAFYGAYFRDLDGNKLAAIRIGAAPAAA